MKNKNRLFILCVSVFCPDVSMCEICLPCAYGGQKKPLDSLELWLRTVVSHSVDAGTEHWSSAGPSDALTTDQPHE